MCIRDRSLFRGGVDADLAQLFEKNLPSCHFARGLVTAVDFQQRIGEYVGKGIGIVQSPVTDKNIVTGGTFLSLIHI